MDIDRIQIAQPCPARWEDMNGDDHARHCAQCDKFVYDSAHLSRAELAGLIREAEGKEMPCVRLHERSDGRVLTSDCPVGLARRTARRLSKVAAGVTSLLLSIPLLSSCASIGGRSAAPDMGMVAEPDPNAGCAGTPAPGKAEVQDDWHMTVGRISIDQVPPKPESTFWR